MNDPPASGRLARLQANVGLSLLLLALAWWLARTEPAFAAAALLSLAVFDLAPARLAAAFWLGAGRLLGRVVSPVALFLLYYAFFTPYAWCFRLLNPKAVDRHFGRGADSLWEARPEGRRTTDFTEPW